MKLYFDGGCKPNPGMMEVAVIVEDGGKRETIHQHLGMGTNNLAEWTAILLAMEVAISRQATDVEIIGDSQLVINQANGTWKVKKPELVPYYEEFQTLKRKIPNLKVTHVLRHKNVAGHHIELISGA